MEEIADTAFRASPQQRHLWSSADSTGGAGWTQLVAEIDSGLDIDRFDHAIDAVAARHEALRTRIRQLGSIPVQVIEETGSIRRRSVDLTAPADPYPELDQLASAEVADLGPDGGVRVALARVAPATWAIVLTAPAEIADRQSLRILLGELAAAYDGRPRDPVLVQYADYAAWHNELLQAGDRAGRRSYWDAHLALPGGETESAPLKRDNAGPWRTSRRRLSRTATGVLSALLAAPLVDKAAPGTGEIERAFFATAWALLWWRLRGGEAVAISSVVPSRSYPDLDNAIGPFARDAPIVLRFATELAFRDAMAGVLDSVGEATEHVDDLDPSRLGGYLRTITAVEYGEPVEDMTLAGAAVRVRGEGERRLTPAVLRASHGPDGYLLELAYDAAWLPPPEADELLDRLLVVIRAVAASPAVSIGAVPLTLPAELERLMKASQGPVARVSSGQTLPMLFQAQARRTPTAVAVDDAALCLTYAELDARADRLARQLAALGLRRGGRVVVYLPRGTRFVVCALAVMKAGAAYVPIDLRQPTSRLSFVLDDVGADLVVVASNSSTPRLSVATLVLSDDESETVPEGPPPAGGDPDDVAYVMYTSGSTGGPNGVPITHRALLNYLSWANAAYAVSRGTGSVVATSVGFDLTVTGLLGPLLVGQRVRILPEGSGIEALAHALRGSGDLTMLKLTPSHLSALTRLIEPAEIARRVRTLVVGGEQLRAEMLAAFRSSSLQIFNEYGPTEATVACCAYQVGPATPNTGPVPIGTPIAGACVYVCDLDGQLVPDGVAGELYVGGVGVAAGYHNRPELSQRRFVADPHRRGERVYRTGDRGYRNPSGELVYLGRVDEQLKIRGVRVEPAEIELALRAHPLVAEAVVVVAEQSSAPAHPPGPLVAFLVATKEPATDAPRPTGLDLVEFCRDRLPDYLIPSAWTWLAGLPTTPNGKLDRAALRRWPVPPSSGEFVAPRDETEEILAGAIASVLGHARVGIDDNYFVLGGDSIRSVMVASRCQARGLPITVADVHRHPTIRALAAAMRAETARSAQVLAEPFALIGPEDRVLLPADVEDAFPLNLLQEGMIFHRDFAAKSAVYHAIASVRLRAPLRLDVMRSVIQQLVQRHPMLRTSFDQTTFSRPLQLVHRTFPDPMSYEDLRGLGPSEQQARIDGFVESEKLRGFELDEYPLIRFMVQRLDDETFQFTYGFHHEIVDGWSEALMVTELFGHYFCVVFDEPITLTPPRSSMREAVALEREALGRQENYDFWTRYLDGATLMRLPRWNSAVAADKGARDIVRITVPVPAALSDALKRLAIQQAAPLKTVLLAAHMAVMHTYNGHDDTLTYTVTNGRPENVDGSTAIGLFVNSLALRVRLAGGTWQELITQTLESERQSLPYRRLPMAELKRHQGNEPLAETLFFFTDYHVFRELDRWRDRGVEHVASELYGESTFPFCAIFRLNRENARLEVRIEYDRLQFAPEMIDAVRDCYVSVLDAMVADPGAPYHTRSFASGRELRQVLDWSASPWRMDAAAERAHEVIVTNSRRWPDAIAVEMGEEALSYGALDRLSGRVAQTLRRRGAGPEAVVGLLAGRSIESMICMLGILRAGAAYLPLDPALPDERLTAIISRARPLLVLADPDHAHRVGAVPVIAMRPGLWSTDARDRGGPPAAGVPAQVAPIEPVGASPAYVIFTSGSTGAPKGVVVSHASLMSSTMARGPVYGGAPQRFLLVSSLAFDSAVAGLFWPMATGQTLLLAPEGIQQEPARLARYLGDHQATHTLCVPSLLAALLDAGEPHWLASLRVAIAAGEASSADLLENVSRAVPGCEFVNEYGPTENTVWSTAWRGEPPSHRRALPIGRPIPGVRTYVLSAHLQPVPVGVIAELYLGGDALARGYLDRPGLTAISFLPDPMATRPGSRMYRTGDLVRHTPDGELEFLGRADHQVKVRGFRVELGEIEAVLDRHPGVARSVVVAREDLAGEKVLVGYVAGRAGTRVDAAELQRYLRDRLPKYMVPSTCQVLDALPLTSTGKVDRSALPAPAEPREVDAVRVAPRTDTEHVLAAIVGQVLGIEDISVHDDFFELGGESLRAMQVVTKANRVFGTDLSVRTLFDVSTVADYARVVDEARLGRAAASESELTALVN